MDAREVAALVGAIGALIAACISAWVAFRMNATRQKFEVQLGALQKKDASDARHEETFHSLNEENWRRVIDQLGKMKHKGHELITKLSALCITSHEKSDEAVLDDFLEIAKLHREFREEMKPLWGEIRLVDYEELELFFKSHGRVLLDIDRTQAQRQQPDRVEVMKRHHQTLQSDDRRLRKLTAHFLQPRARLRVSDESSQIGVTRS